MHHFSTFLLMVGGLVLLTRPLTVFVHELGHAIPAILLTKQKVTVYLGSHGDPQRSTKINVGKLAIFFRYNPFAWRLGLCVPSATEISINRQIAYTLTGPIASLIFSILACYFAFTYDLHGFLKLFLIVFLGSAIFDLFLNLIPNSTPIRLYDGTITYNDGYLLKQLFYYKRLPKEYLKAVDLYNANQYAEAAVLFEKLLLRTKDASVYRYAINAYAQIKNFVKMKEISDDFASAGNMNSDDLSNMALSYSLLGFYSEALNLFNKSLQQDSDNIYSLSNKGYTLIQLNRFEEAILLFDRVIHLDKDFAHSYDNRGFAKIKLGLTAEGIADINYSLKLDENNSYAYLHLGIHHFDRKEFNQALSFFTRAKELDPTTHKIDELIHEAKLKLSKGTI